METTGTWGISGPDFLAIFAAVVVVALVTVRLLRHCVWRRRGAPTDVGVDDLHPCDLSLLGGSDELAVSVALVHLDRAGTLEVQHRPDDDAAPAATAPRGSSALERAARRVRASTLVVPAAVLPADAHPLERAIYRVAASGDVTPSKFTTSSVLDNALREARADLRRRGLAADEALVHRLRWCAAILVVPLTLGVARLIAGVRRGRPVGFLLLGLVVVVVMLVWLVRSVREDSPCPAVRRLFLRARALRRRHYRQAHHDLVVDSVPALGGLSAVALFGTGLLWEANSRVANDLDLSSSLPGGVAEFGSWLATWAGSSSGGDSWGGGFWGGGSWGGGGGGGDGGGGDGGGGGGCGG